ncbi:coiled-coil domain-containing protein 34-like [Musca vetustissima]|uniref:coiled-coil domain-containing protein 34-like n=1 Tax=Musca vetustissima TaxID=27455 RepID=UPI002AB7B6B0|nr:coiled-coil domain-containing protein 34-like [Musca vetustissima]
MFKGWLDRQRKIGKCQGNQEKPANNNMPFYTPRPVNSTMIRCASTISLNSWPSDQNSNEWNLSSRSCEPTFSFRNPIYSCNQLISNSENNCPQECDNYTAEEFKRTITETPGDIVPPLDLQSEENYPTASDDMTYSVKIHRQPELAYETWLSAKRKLHSIEAARRREEAERKRQELEERKRISKEKYEKWLENKSKQQKQQQQLSQHSINVSNSKLILKSQTSISNTSEKSLRSNINNGQDKTHLDEWERTKRLQEERRRMRKQQEEQKRRELEEQRRKAAAEAWEKWLADAAKKPKPVPLNRGIFTLRGTISDIFVNPNEWKTVVPTNGDGMD